jgi:hypothetical protein
MLRSGVAFCGGETILPSSGWKCGGWKIRLTRRTRAEDKDLKESQDDQF